MYKIQLLTGQLTAYPWQGHKLPDFHNFLILPVVLLVS